MTLNGGDSQEDIVILAFVSRRKLIRCVRLSGGRVTVVDKTANCFSIRDGSGKPIATITLAPSHRAQFVNGLLMRKASTQSGPSVQPREG